MLENIVRFASDYGETVPVSNLHLYVNQINLQSDKISIRIRYLLL